MGNLVNLPNITPEALVIEEASTVVKKATTGFDAKNYLNVRLDESDGDSKSLTIRLLPMNLENGSPFVKVHFHNVKVPKEVSKSGFKSYICLSKNDDIDHEKFGTKCPFCEMNKNAYAESLKSDDPVTKKQLQEISLSNLSRESVIVRCIERGKEDEGVKFWKFNIRADKTDPYNQILKLFKLRKEEGDRAGINVNILDLYQGVDLTVTITQGNAAPTIVDGRISCPLSKDEEQMKKWIYDTKKWQDVFTPKSYEYLSLVSQMKIPWYDKANNMWVDKEAYDNEHKTEVEQASNDVFEAETAILEEHSPVKQVQDDIMSAIKIETSDEELPF